MADTTSKPKQMAAYDKFEIIDDEYILHDDTYYSGEDEEVIYENPLQDIENCTYCSTQLIKIENETLQESSHRDYCLWY